MEIDLTPLFDAQGQALELVEDPQKREFGERFIRAAALPLEKAVRNLLAEVLDEVNEAAQGMLEARLVQEGATLRLEVVRRSEERAGEEVAHIRLERGGEIEKLTIRLPPELKKQITDAAALAAASLNTWIANTLARAVGGTGGGEPQERPPGAWGGRRLRGLVGFGPEEED